MAIPKQTFHVLKNDKVFSFYNNYFFPLLSENSARKEYCKFNGCDTPCEKGGVCGITLKEVKQEWQAKK
jgi:hypothetical protein